MLGRFSAYLLSAIGVAVLISPAVLAGPKGRVLCRSLGNLTIAVDGDFSDWPLGSYEQPSVQPLFPGAKNSASTNASGDHIVFERDRIGLFNGTPDHPLTFADGSDDFDSVIYFAWNQDCLYMLEVRVDDLLRDDRRPGPCPDLDVGNDGFSIFIDAKNDSADCASVVSWPLFDTGAPNTDDFELGCNLHSEHRLDAQDPDDVGARQHMERHGISALIDSPCPGAGSYRTILDALPTPDIAARSYADLGAAGALNPVIVNNPGQTFSGYALEVCVPFGFYADFDPSLNPIMGFELFWHETDLCNNSFGCSDAQDDPGTGGSDISWATWAQSTIVDCRSNPADALFQTTNWGEIVFDDSPLLGGFDCTGVVPINGDAFTLELVTSAVTTPVDVGGPPRDTERLFVGELDGRMLAIDLSDDTVSGTPFLDITSRTSTTAFPGAGFLGFTFHPNYAQNGHFYVNYTRSPDTDGRVLISRFTATPPSSNFADPSSELLILELPKPNWGHNGGQLAFGPFDGYLYISMGDGGPQPDLLNHAQRTDILRGKMIRVDVDNPAGGNNYGIPAGNPWAAPGDGVLDEIWALGLRNPWRFAFDPQNGDFYVADVGQGDPEGTDGREEVNYVAADSGTGITAGGANYEWRVREGNKPFDNSAPYGPGNRMAPIHEYSHDLGEGCSVTGGVVYRGCSIPALHGTYFFGDWCSEWVKTLRVVNGTLTDLQDRTAELNAGIAGSMGRILAFGTDGQGEVYISTMDSGAIYRIVGIPGPEPPENPEIPEAFPTVDGVLSAQEKDAQFLFRMECPVPGGSTLLPTTGAPCPSGPALSADIYVSWNDNGICFSADVSDNSPMFTQNSPGPFVDLLEEPPTSEIIITTDNSYTLHVNGQEIGSDSEWQQSHLFNNLPLLSGDNVITVACTDMGAGPGALFADVKIDGNSLSTSSQWKVAKSVGAGWKDVDFDDSTWAAATEYGAYGASPWLTGVADMPLSTDARWIWTTDFVNDNVAYFRFAFVLPHDFPDDINGQDVFQSCFNPNGMSTIFNDGGGIPGTGGIWDIVVETGNGAGPFVYRHGGALLLPGEVATIQVAGTRDASGYVVETCIPWSIAMDDGGYVPTVGDIHGVGFMLLSFNGPTATLYTTFGNGANTISQPATWPRVQLGVGEPVDSSLQLPGDCNQDAVLDLSDAVCGLGVLFTGLPPLFPCGDGSPTDAANIALIDWQPDGSVDLSDVIAMLQFLFFSADAHALAVPGSETTECVAIDGCQDNPNCP